MHYYGQPSSAIKEKINQEHVKQILKNWYWLKTVKNAHKPNPNNKPTRPSSPARTAHI